MLRASRCIEDGFGVNVWDGHGFYREVCIEVGTYAVVVCHRQRVPGAEAAFGGGWRGMRFGGVRDGFGEGWHRTIIGVDGVFVSGVVWVAGWMGADGRRAETWQADLVIQAVVEAASRWARAGQGWWIEGPIRVIAGQHCRFAGVGIGIAAATAATPQDGYGGEPEDERDTERHDQAIAQVLFGVCQFYRSTGVGLGCRAARR